MNNKYVKCIECETRMTRLAYSESFNDNNITINSLECDHCGSKAIVTYNEKDERIEEVSWRRK